MIQLTLTSASQVSQINFVLKCEILKRKPGFLQPRQGGNPCCVAAVETQRFWELDDWR